MFFLKSGKMAFQCRHLRFSILLSLLFFFTLAAVIPAIRLHDGDSTPYNSTKPCSTYLSMSPKAQVFTKIGNWKSIIKVKVTINSRNIIFVRVDIPDVTKLPGGKKCIMSDDGPMGLLYHIHEKWSNRRKTWGIGSDECHDNVTKGHWDPTYACSKSSSTFICNYIPSSSVLKNGIGRYVCDPEIYATAPFACEVGDLSGKFGPIVMRSSQDPRNPNKYFGEERYNDLLLGGWCMLHSKSIVLHCRNNERLACGKIQIDSKYDVHR